MSFSRASLRPLSQPIPFKSGVRASSRFLSRSHSNLNDSKDSSSRLIINVQRDEYSKTGGDHVVAEQKIASFHPGDTKPESQMETAGKGIKTNPLEISPANKEASKFSSEIEGPWQKSDEKKTWSRMDGSKRKRLVDRFGKRGNVEGKVSDFKKT